MWFVNEQAAFARQMQPPLRRDEDTEAYHRRLAVVHYAVAVLVVVNVIAVLNRAPFIL